MRRWRVSAVDIRSAGRGRPPVEKELQTVGHSHGVAESGPYGISVHPHSKIGTRADESLRRPAGSPRSARSRRSRLRSASAMRDYLTRVTAWAQTQQVVLYIHNMFDDQ